MTGAATESQLSERLRGVIVRIRSDLEFTRHVFRGEPCYVARDPVNFSTHRFSVADYRLLVAVDTDRPLGETFMQLCADGELDAEDQDEFFAFVVGLHRTGLLALPIGDHKALFTRHSRRESAKKVSRLLSPFFLRLPLCNPDTFLDQTVAAVRWVFGPVGLALWSILVLLAGAVAFVRRDELAAPLLTILELDSLPLLWLVLIGLKVFHEFGHAYACKVFGGKVPEMGVFMIMGTPCAYVDATAAWGFSALHRRMIVNLGGMYFELFFAAAGVLVWASTPPGLLNTAAYQVALMASVVTVAFNLNPLAKFDGYYMLSDMVGIPNLRRQAAGELKAIAARIFLGLRSPASAFGPVTRLGLVSFGIGSAIYRITIMLGLSAILASKLFVIGLFLAGAYVAMTVLGSGYRLARFLLWSPETTHVRGRGVAVATIGLVVAVLGLAVLPYPRDVRVVGVVTAKTESVLFVPQTARLEEFLAKPGQSVKAGDPIAELDNEDLRLDVTEQAVAVHIARIEHDAAAAVFDPNAIAIFPRLQFLETSAGDAADRLQELSVRSPISGRVIETTGDLHPGATLRAGTPLARVGAGPWVVRLYADTQALRDADFSINDVLELRSPADAGDVHFGTITSIAPLGTREIPRQGVTQAAGGPITIDPMTGLAARPYYEIIVELDENGRDIAHGTIMTARAKARPETFARVTLDRLRRFAAALETH